MILPDELRHKRVGVIGLGVNNLALVEWLLAHQIGEVTICDQNPGVRLEHPDWEGKVSWRLGDRYLHHLTDFQMILRTPGIPYLSTPIVQAKQAGVEISSQTKLFFALSPAKIIGVTGTKGKGTTASLIAEMLTAYSLEPTVGNQPKVYLAGNIGTDPFVFLDELTPNDWVVLELSSFQLQDMEQSPDIAVVLNITSDHLDHHATRDEYVEAKSTIVRYQTPKQKAVIYLDSLTTQSLAELTRAEVWYFSRRKSVDQGAFIEWVQGEAGRWGNILLRTKEGDHLIAHSYDLRLRGDHNLENVTAAVTAAYLAGVPIPLIAQGAKSFRGLEHRLELVAEGQGRVFYNDSFATNPEPVMAAVASFREPIHLIVGGSTKGADFRELGQAIALASTVKSLIPLGHVEGIKIAEAVRAAQAEASLESTLVIHHPVVSMEAAVELAMRSSAPGEVILLSPGAASFDLFTSYKERGKAFRHAATKVVGGAR